MFNINKQKSTHGSRLERWIGAEQAERISKQMANWYGPPIALAGVPGNVWAHKGGDFHGVIKSGQFIPAVEFAVMRLKKALQAHGLKSRQQCNAGFSSLSDLISEATTGKMRHIIMQKTGVAGASLNTSSLWTAAGQPTAGAIGSAAPGGRATDDTTTGAVLGLDNCSPDTRHVVSGQASSSIAANTLMMYDRLFDVAKTMNSIATESVTGVPTRYQSSTATDPDFAGGNFCFPEVITTISGTAHNWTVCRYRNQDGTDTISFPSAAGVSGAVAGRIDLTSQFFLPLATGDTGVMDLDQLQCSALVAAGTMDFVIGHPICFLPCPIAAISCSFDGINTAFNLVRIFDDACLAFLELNKPSATASAYVAQITTVAG